MDVERLEEVAYAFTDWLWSLPKLCSGWHLNWLGTSDADIEAHGEAKDFGEADVLFGLLVHAPKHVQWVMDCEAELARNNIRGPVEMNLAHISKDVPSRLWVRYRGLSSCPYVGTSGYTCAAGFFGGIYRWLFDLDIERAEGLDPEEATTLLRPSDGTYGRLRRDMRLITFVTTEQTDLLSAQLWWEFYQAGGGLPGAGPWYSMRDICRDLGQEDNRTVKRYFDRAEIEPPKRGQTGWRIDGETYSRLLQTIETHGVNDTIRNAARMVLQTRPFDIDAIT